MDIEREEQDHQSIEKENVISQDNNHVGITDKQLECSLVAPNSCPDCGIKIGKRTVTHRCRVEGTVRDEEIRPSIYTRKQCPNCKREFRKTTTFASHKCKKKSKVGKSGIGIPGNTESGNLQCPHCKRFYVSRKALVFHIRMLHKKAQCTICGLFLANYGLVKTHKLAAHTERIECPQCKKTFTKMTFQNHLNSHKEASHLCPECGVMFKSGQNLQVHLKRFHSPGKVPSMKVYIRKEKSKKRKIGEEVSVSEGAGTEDED
ncbi:hypothetical protein RP20_CCG019686 [Aedes albopictus]|nr:hypothetical protein RP20_CCG019686 [Aedes albopictus]